MKSKRLSAGNTGVKSTSVGSNVVLSEYDFVPLSFDFDNS